jgi:hypothetical protein
VGCNFSTKVKTPLSVAWLQHSNCISVNAAQFLAKASMPASVTLVLADSTLDSK